MKTSSKIGIAVVVIAIIAIVAFVLVRTSGHEKAGVLPVVSTTNVNSFGTQYLCLGTNCNDSYAAQNAVTQLSAPTTAVVSATTTPCAILSPSATSTLISFSMNLTTGTSTSATVTLATSTTAYATTSAVSTFTGFVSSNLPNALSWEGGGNSTNIVYPSTYVVVGEAAPTSVNGGFVQAGRCTATFQTI